MFQKNIIFYFVFPDMAKMWAKFLLVSRGNFRKNTKIKLFAATLLPLRPPQGL